MDPWEKKMAEGVAYLVRMKATNGLGKVYSGR
jgi:hypothetical protein